MAPGQVLFDEAGLGRGKVGGRGIGKSAAVRGLERCLFMFMFEKDLFSFSYFISPSEF